MNIFEKLAVVFFVSVMIPLVSFLVYALLVVMPVQLYADAKCLKNGYPKAEVTIGLEMYCMNMDGAITVKVDKLK